MANAQFLSILNQFLEKDQNRQTITTVARFSKDILTLAVEEGGHGGADHESSAGSKQGGSTISS